VVRERGIEWSRGRDHGSCAFSEVVRVETFDFSVMRQGWQTSGIRITTRSGAIVRMTGSLTERAALLSSLAGRVPPAPLPKATAQRRTPR